jgi:hypothetical protein
MHGKTYAPVGLTPPESPTVAEGVPLGWFEIVNLFILSRITVLPCSWFWRCTLNWPKPAEQPEPVVIGRTKEGGGAVRFIWRGIPKNGSRWLMSSWKIASSDVGLVQKKFGLAHKEEITVFPTGESVMSIWPLWNALNIVVKSP